MLVVFFEVFLHCTAQVIQCEYEQEEDVQQVLVQARGSSKFVLVSRLCGGGLLWSFALVWARSSNKLVFIS
jgi:hypothetical protein